MALTDKLVAIADAIRSKTGLTGELTPEQMPDEIRSISGGAAALQSKTVTPNGATLTVRPDSNYDGLSTVTVKGDANLMASNIVSGVTIYGVTGTASAGNSGDDSAESLETCMVSFSTDGWATKVGYLETFDDAGYINKQFTTADVEADTEYNFSVIKGSLFIVGTVGDYDGYTTINGGAYSGKIGYADVFMIEGECSIWDGYY